MLRRVLAVLLLAGAALPAAAQPDPATMSRYVLGLLRNGPAWTPAAAGERHELAERLLKTGLLAGAGPVFDDEQLAGVLIFALDSVAAAERLSAADPAIRENLYTLELHPWYAGEGIGDGLRAARAQQADSMPPLIEYQFGLLRRGPAWTPERTPEVEKIQAGHMANINRLAEAGTLVMAGPLTDNGTVRGVFVFRTGSLAEAESLGATDPAVQAGRLALDLYRWLAPAGVVPTPAEKRDVKPEEGKKR